MKNLKNFSGAMSSLTPSATMSITSRAKAMEDSGEDICAMSAGESDFDTPDHIKEAANKALSEGKTRYTPATGIPELKKIVAEKFTTENNISTTPERVIIAPGAKFSVFSALAAVCGPGDEVFLPAPYWVSYPEMVKATGARNVILSCKPSNNYELNPTELESKITENTKLLILNTPSNPTGSVYRESTLREIAKLAVKYNFLVLADEIYEKLLYDAESPHVSIASLSPEIANLTITVNGLSKAYAMTGWRIGYLTAPTWICKRVSAFQSHTTSNPTTFAQYGALAAITGDQGPIEIMRQEFAKRRDLIYKLMSAIPRIDCVRPAGAFYIFCDISSFGLGSVEFCLKLLESKKVAVIPGEPFGADGNIRLSYACAPRTIQEASERIGHFCRGL